MKAILSDAAKQDIIKYFEDNFQAYGIKLSFHRDKIEKQGWFNKTVISAYHQQITIEFINQHGIIISSLPVQTIRDGDTLTISFDNIIQRNSIRFDE